jgi:hypothetical protein
MDRCLPHQALLGLLGLSAAVAWLAAACGEPAAQTNPAATGGSFAATGGALDAALPTGGTSASGTGGQSCAEPVPGARTHPGNFDTQSCNSPDCHTDSVGGWLYNNAAGDMWIGEATVTITSSDGTVVTAVTASDGFFNIEGPITPPYMCCVSLCPNTDCTITAHTSTDCQDPACHGGTSPRIYLTQEPDDPQGTGGTGGGGEDCIPAASGGPRQHMAAEYDTFGCQICHDQDYTGGFLYDALGSNTPVAGATFTLTAEDGTVLTAVTGPGGMFYFPGLVPAPYTICVSKCPDTVCAGPEDHPDNSDCRTCHDETQKLHLP